MNKDLLDQVNLLNEYYNTGKGLYRKKQVKELEKKSIDLSYLRKKVLITYGGNEAL